LVLTDLGRASAAARALLFERLRIYDDPEMDAMGLCTCLPQFLSEFGDVSVAKARTYSEEASPLPLCLGRVQNPPHSG